MSCCQRIGIGCAIAVLMGAAPALAVRQEGVDVSQFQLTVDWPTVAASGKSFAFVRATRGGTTTDNGRVDDTNFVQNITGAKNAGLLTGAYHFARPDISTSTPEDEAQHFISVAGPYLQNGYLRPVLDLEAGGTERTTTDLTDWALRFCNTIALTKGEAARPIVYVTRNYANVELTNGISVNGKTLSDHPLWLADPDGTNNATGLATDPQTDPTPPPFYLGTTPFYPNPLGLWGPDTGSTPFTWSFWQYSQGKTGVAGFSTGVDLDVYHSELGPISMLTITPEPTGLALAMAGLVLLQTRRRQR